MTLGARRGAVALLAAIALLVTGCASLAGGGASQGEPLPAPTGPAWPIVTRYQVDLWLHGYAMLSRDTTLVPYFERGYRDRMTALRQRANVSTQLDRNRDALSAALAASPGLVAGQFLPLYFDSWESMQRAIAACLQAGGDPRQSGDQATQTAIAIVAASYPTAADRDWLRSFTEAVQDEGTRWYRSYWDQEQRARSGAYVALDSLWTKVYLPRFRGFLNDTRQSYGELVLSLPLDGEGRTIVNGNRSNEIAVAYPASDSEALAAVYVFAHEAIGTLANQAIADNTTPAEKRDGAADRYASPAAVRGGALLLQRVAPGLVPGYQRHYLRSAGAAWRAGDEAAAFTRTFALPVTIAQGLERQLAGVMSGI